MDALKKAQEAKTKAQGETDGDAAVVAAKAKVDTAAIDDAEFASFMEKSGPAAPSSSATALDSLALEPVAVAPSAPLLSPSELTLSIEDPVSPPVASSSGDERSVVKTYAPKVELGLQLDTSDGPVAPPPSSDHTQATSICDDVLSDLEKDLAKQPEYTTPASVSPAAPAQGAAAVSATHSAAAKAAPVKAQAEKAPQTSPAPQVPPAKAKVDHPRQAARILAASARPGGKTPWLRTALLGGGALLLVTGLGGGYFYSEYQKLTAPMAKVPPPLPRPLFEESDPMLAEEEGDEVRFAELTNIDESPPAQMPKSAAMAEIPRNIQPKPIAPVAIAEPTPAPLAQSPTPSAAVDASPSPAQAVPEKPRAPVEFKREEPKESIAFRELSAAYDAYQTGNMSHAAERYRNVLAHMPENRDALLGLAAISQKSGEFDQARGFYQMALRLNRHDSVALAGWYSVIADGDPTAVESELKVLLAKEGDVPYLQFALGNAYARQNKWLAAEQAFGKAHRLDPSNGDYVYNLAVAVDQLGQANAASRYYELALSLDRGGVVFDRDQVTRRLQQLRVGP